jgi:hypothetical protein
MSPRAPSSIGWFVLVAAFLLPLQAKAWIETSVRSHQARVEVEADGHATIRHELVLKVRGGPMKFLEIEGIGTDIEPLPDALVRLATLGSSSKWPLLISSLEDGGIRLRIGAERGLRGGTYLFHFAYKADLKDLGLISRGPFRSEVSWIGPRLTSGVDIAKVIFAVPRGKNPPGLLQSEDAGGEVLLGELRRGENFDEVELVRAHLATGEPAIWKIEIDSEVLTGVPSRVSEAQTPLSEASVQLRGRASGLNDGVSTLRLLAALGLSLTYGLLVFLKALWMGREAQRIDFREKPLIPGPPWFRGALSAVLVVVSAYFALDQRPWQAVMCAGFALFNATYLLPTRYVRARGPGRWIPMSDDRPAHEIKRPLVQIFETTNARGFLFFLVLTLPLVALAYRILPSSNYLALMTMIFALLLVPLFWTGRLRDLPQGPLAQARPWLGVLRRALDAEVATAQLWGRVPALGDESSPQNDWQRADEARLRIVLVKTPPGLRALEISFEETAGAAVSPCVVLRVTDDSLTKDRLPGEIPWQRGRTSDERVALLRPTAPTKAQLLRLLRSLLTNLRATAQSSVSEAAPTRRARRSSGRADSMLNAGKPLPSQAM